MAQPSGREEYARESECQIKNGPVDRNATGVSENVETGINQDEADMDNHDRYMTRASNLFQELGSAENNDSAAMNPEMETPSAALQPEPRILSSTEPSETEEFLVKMGIESALLDKGENFQKKIVKYGKNYYTIRCAIEGCPWCTCAVAGDGYTLTFNPVRQEHTCGFVTHPGHQRPSVQQVACSVEQPLRENPHYRPKEISKEIHRVHGMPLSHEQASRHQEHYMASAPGSFEEDYSLLSQYCDKVRQANPGSLASLYVKNPKDASSLRMFIAYQASIFGFLNACRPLVWLDQTVLRNKYPLNLLFATGFDGDGAFFPLAFAVVGQENDANWMWFLSVLQNLLETQDECIPKLTILSGTRRSILAAVKTNFPTAYHRLCMHLFSKSFQKFNHNSIIVNHLWKAANAFEPSEFEIEVLNIEKISPVAAHDVRIISPRFWSNSHFKGLCFSYPAVSVVELLKAWIHEANGLPIVQVMECLHHKLSKLFNERREASMKWTSVLVPSAEKQVSEALHCARSYEVSIRNNDEFLVISQEGKEVVNIRRRCCSCKRWQRYGLPCSHAAVALLYCRQNVCLYAWNCFTVATYRKAYSQSINPIIPDIVVNTAKSQEQERKRTQSSDPCQEKRVRRCSSCKQSCYKTLFFT